MKRYAYLYYTRYRNYTDNRIIPLASRTYTILLWRPDSISAHCTAILCFPYEMAMSWLHYKFRRVWWTRDCSNSGGEQCGAVTQRSSPTTTIQCIFINDAVVRNAIFDIFQYDIEGRVLIKSSRFFVLPKGGESWFVRIETVVNNYLSDNFFENFEAWSKSNFERVVSELLDNVFKW